LVLDSFIHWTIARDKACIFSLFYLTAVQHYMPL
jgi:hypothetical protein